MRRYLLLLTIFSFLLYGHAFAQTPISNAPEQNCPGAIPVCHGDYQQNNAYTGHGTDSELTMGSQCSTIPIGNNGALLSGERNGVWYVINVVCPGYFCFDLIPNTSTDDYDWAVWDITGGGCSLIYNYTTNTANPYPPYGSTCVPTYNQGASNYQPNLGFMGWTGLSNNPTVLATNAMYNQAPLVTGGQTFALLVSNFTGSQHGYHLSFDSSTACLYDTVKPVFVSAGSKCGFSSDNINVAMSVPILCNTIDTDGSDFYVTPPLPSDVVIKASSTLCTSTGPTSTTTTFNLQFASVVPPGTYWLHPKVGSDGNTTVDLCGNTQSTTDSIEFILTAATPPVVVSLDTPACNKVRLVFDRGVKCSTVDVDGSDFQITDAAGDIVVVNKVLKVSCNDIGLVDTLDLFFSTSIVKPGQYTINIVTGDDGNPITDTCDLVVASPAATFYVSDGGVTATAYPNQLCAQGYFELGAATVLPAPPPLVTSCGANGTVCTGGGSYQAGTGTNSMSRLHTPFGGSNTQRRTRMLFTAAELKALGVGPGTFSQLAFNIVTKNTMHPFENLTIKMGCTADSLIDTSQGFPAAFSPALEIVYGPKSYTTSAGWNYFQLDNTYDWSATENLMVELCYSNTVIDSNDIVQGGILPYQSFCVYTQNTTVPGCALASINGVFDANRPNMQFTFCPQDTIPVYNWVWTPSNYLYNGLTDTTSAYAYQTTTYTATVLDNNYCYRRDTALLTISPRSPQLGPLDTALCIGSSVVLQANGGVSYQWYPATGLSCATCATTTVTIDTTTTYHVGIYDQYNCGDTLQATVAINYLPLISVTPKDTLVMYQVPVQLEAYSPSARIYLWQPVTGLDNPDVPNPLAAPDTNTLYIVTVVDTNNCVNTDSLTVRIYERGVEIPSAFTPNGDGKNDVFRVANLTSQKVAEFRVFNRWGQQVFDGASTNRGWDGTFNGVEQGIGTYNYLIRIAFHDGSLKSYTGSVTLIR